MEQVITEQEFNSIKSTYTSLREEHTNYCGKECIHYIDDTTNEIVLKTLLELDVPVAYIKV